MTKTSFRNMEDRRGEIPRMIEILDKNKDWKSLTFFQYRGGNADLLKPLTKIRVSKRKAYKRTEYSVIIGIPNYAEREYVKKFKKQQAEAAGDKGCWPDDFFERYPKAS